MEVKRQNHEFPPVYDENSEILILGSFPSVKSREMQFFYGHPQNRFWKVLQFAFGSGSDNEYLPHNYTPNSVVYTGTHDNETLMQYLECTQDHVRSHIREYMNRPHASNGELCENLIWMAMSSVGKYCVIPIQDYLGLGKEARMNYPSTLGHNWEWRVRKEQLTHDLASYIAHMTGLSYRWRIDPPKEEETNETDTENK